MYAYCSTEVLVVLMALGLLLPHIPWPSSLLGFGGSRVRLGCSPVPASETDPREQKPSVPVSAETAAATKP